MTFGLQMFWTLPLPGHLLFNFTKLNLKCVCSFFHLLARFVCETFCPCVVPPREASRTIEGKAEKHGYRYSRHDQNENPNGKKMIVDRKSGKCCCETFGLHISWYACVNVNNLRMRMIEIFRLIRMGNFRFDVNRIYSHSSFVAVQKLHHKYFTFGHSKMCWTLFVGSHTGLHRIVAGDCRARLSGPNDSEIVFINFAE